MPYYVQRNWRGEVTGLYANPQPQSDGTSLTEPDPLPDTHPDVVAYLLKHPIPAEMLERPTDEEARQSMKEHWAVIEEHKALVAAVERFNGVFSRMDLCLSTLLYAALGMGESQVAFAIYFSPTSFDARCEIVSNVVIQLASENEALKELLPLWTPISKRLDRARRLRNAIAHGGPLTIHLHGKNHVRLSPPAFDIIRLGRGITKNGVPGLSAHEISEGANKVVALAECVDAVNRLMTEWRSGNPSLQHRYHLLKLGLTKLGSQLGSDPTPSKP